MQKNKKNCFVGQWRVSGEQIAVLFIVKRTATGFSVEAIDEADGEELVVTKVKWSGNVLSFETLTPSNKWRTKNRLKMISENKAIHELTHWELWRKLPDSDRRAGILRTFKRKAKTQTRRT